VIILKNNDCIDALFGIPENSIDACATDPPYHLDSIVKRFGKQGSAPAQSKQSGVFSRSSAGFMHQTWDGGDIAFNPETWAAVKRVLKPGAFMFVFAATRNFHKMATAIETAGFTIRDMLAWTYGTGFPKSKDIEKYIGKTGEDGSHWHGYGTALKPAIEPICVAQKPFSEKTIAANVLKWGTGGLNIDGCRVEGNRWPANFLHDGSDQVTEIFEEQGVPEAYRFFYCSKPTGNERKSGNGHPTMKPISLMQYLVRLATPPEGVVLDPFMGTGTTGIAAVNENLSFVGIEREPAYFATSYRRIMDTKRRKVVDGLLKKKG